MPREGDFYLTSLYLWSNNLCAYFQIRNSSFSSQTEEEEEEKEGETTSTGTETGATGVTAKRKAAKRRRY